jgi:uroporphyrinogen decarboxylase
MSLAAEAPRNRLYRTLMDLPVDRVADHEFGFWPQTIRRWVAEGAFPRAWADEMGDAMFHDRFNEFIGTDGVTEKRGELRLRLGMIPEFDVIVLAEDGKTQTIRDRNGIVAKRWKPGSDEASIPEYLEFPVKCRADWERLKERYRIDDPQRGVESERIDEVRRLAAQGWMVCCGTAGFYGQLRYWVGVENLSYMVHDEPDLVQDMMDHWAALILSQLRKLPADVPIHMFDWWEDMCFNHGPLLSPAMFDRFMVPRYEAVMAQAARRGCALSHVDCDGNIHALVDGWMKAGIRVMFPCEVAAGTDMFALRRRYGKAVKLQGGIDKKAVAAGRSAIDRELARVAPLLEQGGYVPHLDHLVPPDISFDDYAYYRRQKKKLIGKA